jgi:hypothetical protein
MNQQYAEPRNSPHSRNNLPATLDPTAARFSLRSLLIAIAIFAVASAAGGAVLRQCSENARQRLMIFWALLLVGVITWIAIQFARRRRAERRAGPSLLQMAANSDRPNVLLVTSNILRGVLIVFLITIFSLVVALQTNSPSAIEGLLAWGFPLLSSIGLISYTVSHCLWGGDVHLCEFGVLWDQRMMPWSDVVNCQWKGRNGDRLELYGIDADNAAPSIAIHVWSEDREAVQKILNAKRNPSRLLLDGREIDIAKAPITSVVGKPHFRKHFWCAIVGLFSGATLVQVYFWWPAGARGFDEAMMVGVFVCIFVFGLERRWTTKRAGAPIGLLFARRGWLGFVATVLAAVTLYASSRYVIWPTDWLAYIAGICYLYLSFKTISYFFVTELQLRANGIVMPGAFFCPWRRVRVVKWEPAHSRLVLRAGGLRTIVAHVPPPNADSIAALLNEKLGWQQSMNPAS